MATRNELVYRIEGIAPLVMNSPQAMFVGRDPNVDKLATKKAKLVAKRSKTESDLDEIRRLEFLLALYLYDDKPIIPGDVIEGCLYGKSGAASSIKGITRKKAALAILALGPFSLEYEGPTDPHELQKLPEFNFWSRVVRHGSSIVVVRPIFQEWAAIITLSYVPNLIDEADVTHLLTYAGEFVGIMDWRPKYGRFTVTKI